MPARRRAAQLVVAPVVAPVVALVLVTGLTGCGGKDAATSGRSATVGPGMDPTKNVDTARRYFEAVASNDADTQADALEYASPDSPAAMYMTYLQDAASAFAAGDEARDPDTLTAEEDGSYRVCQSEVPKNCVRYSAIVLSDGRVLAFTVGGRAITKRVALGTGAVADLGRVATVEILSRSVNQAGLVFVNLHVAGGAAPVTLRSEDAVFREADGREFAAVRAVGPDELGPNDDANVLLVFDGPTPKGGSLDYSVSARGDEETVTLRLG